MAGPFLVYSNEPDEINRVLKNIQDTHNTKLGSVTQIVNKITNIKTPVSNSGSVTSVSGGAAGGFSVGVANPSTNPMISVGTTVTGVLKGSGGSVVAASPGTDYQAPYAILSTLGALANALGWLHNDGTGILTYSTPTATNVGAEPYAGLPAVDGYVWSSTALGVRSWVPQSGGSGGSPGVSEYISLLYS